MFKSVVIIALFAVCTSVSCQSVPGTTHVSDSLTHVKRGFAIVELFTSEGCSSCPPADRLATELIEQSARDKNNILVIGEHVDYWDKIGWKDPFSNSFFTERQHWYAGFLKDDGVYTPQMVVNGEASFVGSDRKIATSSVSLALEATRSSVEISISLQDSSTNCFTFQNYETSNNEDLHVILLERKLESEVLKGENKGLHLVHSNVVRDWKTFENSSGKATVYFKNNKVFNKRDFQVIAFVQDKLNGKIRAAGELK